jgi:diphthamide synthase (EF-2-diphthine--ammonia ligase)
VVRSASWDGYEAAFLDGLAELRGELGVEVGVFGDIDLQPHRDWVERVCAVAGLRACLPLWRESRRALLDELLATGVGACGEEGEFHTVVTEAPLYAAPVAFAWRGTVAIDQYRFVEVVDEPPPPTTSAHRPR